MKSSPAGSSRIASSRSTTWRGEARLERVRPEPSTAWTPEPSARAKASTTRGAGGGRAGAAEVGAEQLDQRLGEEVVGVDVGDVDDLVSVGERTSADPFGVRPASARARPAAGTCDAGRAAASAASFVAASLAGSEEKPLALVEPLKPELKARPESGPM